METQNRSISYELRKSILKRDGYVCRYCGNETPPFHIDHVYPFSKGGETSTDNLVTACANCNLVKNNKVGEWPKPIGYFKTKRINPLIIIGVADLIFASLLLFIGSAFYGWIAFGGGIFLSLIGMVFEW